MHYSNNNSYWYRELLFQQQDSVIITNTLQIAIFQIQDQWTWSDLSLLLAFRLLSSFFEALYSPP